MELPIHKALHITELRAAIDTLRVRYHLSAVSWTDPTITAGTTSMKAAHITELQSALREIYTAAGATPPTFTTLTAGTSAITVQLITEVRTAILTIW